MAISNEYFDPLQSKISENLVLQANKLINNNEIEMKLICKKEYLYITFSYFLDIDTPESIID